MKKKSIPVTVLACLLLPLSAFAGQCEDACALGCTTTCYAACAAACADGAGLVINEIHYNPVGSDADLEYVELLNAGSTPVDLSGYVFFNGSSNTIPDGISIAPGEYILLARNPAFYAGSFQIIDIAGTLGNTGDELELRAPDGTVIDAVAYTNDPPWPVEADGDGPSLELIDPAADNALAENWAASAVSGGTPGMPNSMAAGSDCLADCEDECDAEGIPACTQQCIAEQCEVLIELDAFEARPGSGEVIVSWKTASEIDNAGFNLYRNGTKVNDRLIPSRGAVGAGSAYALIDDDVQNGTAYSYQLEDVDVSGMATRHPPVSATPRLLYGMFK